MDILFACIDLALVFSAGLYLFLTVWLFKRHSTTYKEALHKLKNSNEFAFFVGTMVFFSLMVSMIVTYIIQAIKEL